jgi:hypothetical protein
MNKHIPSKLRDQLTSAAIKYIGTPMERGKPPNTLAFREVADAIIEKAGDLAVKRSRSRR